jgi:hypothetical protein
MAAREQEPHSTSPPPQPSPARLRAGEGWGGDADERTNDNDVYVTPSEYIRDLIRQDMQDRGIALNVLEGLDDMKHGSFSSKSILDFKD